MKAAVWGTRSSGDALAAMLRPRAGCTVVLSLEDALRYFDARVSGASSAEALQSIELAWHALRDRWRRRRQRLDYGDCPLCEHPWTSHLGMTDPDLDACDDCLYDSNHDLPMKTPTPCQALAPQPPLP